MNIKNKTICFVAGKSGGHIIPAITIAKKLIKKDKNTNILFFSTNTKLDNKILNSTKESMQNLSHITLSLDNIPYKKIFRFPIFFYSLTSSFLKSFFTLIKKRPQKIISMGGYVSIPVCLAGYLLKIPIELFELNATPGKAVKFLSPFATNICVCFKKAINYLPQTKCKLTPYPIRFDNFNNLEQQEKQKTKIHKKLGFSSHKHTILILGGSQGSIAINNLIKQILIKRPNLSPKIQIIHQTGDKDNTNWSAFYKQTGVCSHVFAFNNNIEQYYLATDTVICRSGAGTLFETLFFNKKCITIPLETATTAHQVDNAKEIANQYPNSIKMARQSNKSELLIQIIEEQIHNIQS